MHSIETPAEERGSGFNKTVTARLIIGTHKHTYRNFGHCYFLLELEEALICVCSPRSPHASQHTNALIMASAASSLLRASRSKLASSTSTSVSRVFSRSVPRRTPGSSSAARSFGSAVPRWSHGIDWRSPLGLRHQIRAVAPLIERFHRRIATSGTSLLSPAILELCFF